MNAPLYEFRSQDSPRRRGHWLTVALLVPALVAVGWGIFLLEKRRSHALLQENFDLTRGFLNNVIISVNAEGPEVDEGALESLARHPNLRTVDLGGTTKVPGGLQPLVEISDLRRLYLRDCLWVNDAEAAQLSKMKELERLGLSGTSITVAGLRAISELPRLSELKFEDCPGITDAGLDICAGMNQLRAL